MTPPRLTPLGGELLPGHSRFTLYFKFSWTDRDAPADVESYSIEELDVDADDIYQAHEFGLEVMADPAQYEPGGQLMTEHTATRHPGEMYF